MIALSPVELFGHKVARSCQWINKSLSLSYPSRFSQAADVLERVDLSEFGDGSCIKYVLRRGAGRKMRGGYSSRVALSCARRSPLRAPASSQQPWRPSMQHL